MNRFTRWWLNLNASLWFLPVLMVLIFLALAYGLVNVDPTICHALERKYPLVFGAGAEAARSMLAALSTSMITVAALIFTLTLTTLAQVSSQYLPRVICTFVRDRGNQVVLGSFVGIFAYCLAATKRVKNPLADGHALQQLTRNVIQLTTVFYGNSSKYPYPAHV